MLRPPDGGSSALYVISQHFSYELTTLSAPAGRAEQFEDTDEGTSHIMESAVLRRKIMGPTVVCCIGLVFSSLKLTAILGFGNRKGK